MGFGRVPVDLGLRVLEAEPVLSLPLLGLEPLAGALPFEGGFGAMLLTEEGGLLGEVGNFSLLRLFTPHEDERGESQFRSPMSMSSTTRHGRAFCCLMLLGAHIITNIGLDGVILKRSLKNSGFVRIAL